MRFDDLACFLLFSNHHYDDPQEGNNHPPDDQHTQKELIDYAKTKGIEPQALGTILKAGGISGFDPKRWLDMKALVDQAREAQLI